MLPTPAQCRAKAKEKAELVERDPRHRRGLMSAAQCSCANFSLELVNRQTRDRAVRVVSHGSALCNLNFFFRPCLRVVDFDPQHRKAPF
jgi:hypothetical protein